MSDLIKGLWPRGLSAWIALALGALSVLGLFQHTLNYGFGPTFELVLAYYDRFLHGLVGWWTEPVINAVLARISACVGWEFKLYPHWKHAFVLMWLYFGAAAKAKWSLGDRRGTVFITLWGGIVALLFGIASGTVPILKEESSPLLVVFPVAGVVLFGLGYAAWYATLERREGLTWSQDFGLYASYYFWIVLVGAVAVVVDLNASHVPLLRSTSNPSLTILAILIVALSLYEIGYGGAMLRGQGESWRSRFLNDTATRVGLAMLLLFGLVVAVVLLNAGLQFYGL